jgi:hypothetical protein
MPIAAILHVIHHRNPEFAGNSHMFHDVGEEGKLIESGITCPRTLKIQLVWLVYMIAHAA